MFSSHGTFRLIATALLASLVLVGLSSSEPLPAWAAWTPCDDVVVVASPPHRPPEPEIAGQVDDADNATGVSGATVKLYRCDAGGPTLVDTETTNSNGAFDFGDQTGPDWYYVEVLKTGPLSGMDEVSGTVNPSAPIDVGPGDGAMLFEFES